MGGKKDKKKGNKTQEPAAGEVPTQEAAQMEEPKPQDGGELPQQVEVTADETKPETNQPKETPEDPKEPTAAAPVPNKETDVNGLLVELLSASHDAIDGYQQLNKGRSGVMKIKWSRAPKCSSQICRGSWPISVNWVDSTRRRRQN